MKRTAAIMMVLSISSILSAGTTSIGSVISYGDLQIDNHPVRTSGTIFDGSVIETGSSAISSVDVRLNGNARLTLHSDSRGTIYRDHLVLLRGEAELDAPPSFRTEVTGLTISSSEPRTSGLISIGRDGVVNVSVQAGSFRVSKDSGLFLAQVSSQKALALSPAASGEWRVGNGWGEGFEGDHDHCYHDDDDRDCDHHHHHHPSK